MSHYTTYDPDNDYSHEPEDDFEQFRSGGFGENHESTCVLCGAFYGDKAQSSVNKWEAQHAEACK